MSEFAIGSIVEFCGAKIRVKTKPNQEGIWYGYNITDKEKWAGSVLTNGYKEPWTPPTPAEREHLLKCADARRNGRMWMVDGDLRDYLGDQGTLDQYGTYETRESDARILESLAYDGM